MSLHEIGDDRKHPTLASLRMLRTGVETTAHTGGPAPLP
jgi:hypothetical protein